MIKTIYWISRALAYIACLGGVILHLSQSDCGIPAIGIGFIAFFISYAIRAWLRFAPKPIPQSPEQNNP